MTFQLDTSGTVHFGAPYAKKHGLLTFYRWSDLDPFTQGYVEALFGSVGRFEAVRAADLAHPGKVSCKGFSDLAPETLARIIADCEAWRSEFSGSTRDTSAQREDMGREFWRIRQAGKRSTFPPLTVSLGDDGKVGFA